MCNCIEKTKQLLKEKLPAETVDFDCTGISFSSFGEKWILPFAYGKADAKKKKRSYMIAEYCPLCGEKITEAEANR